MVRRLLCLIALFFIVLCVSAQDVVTIIAARGTGRTTGHIITLTVRNNTGETIEVTPSIFYVPSKGRYQSYVGRIPPGTQIPPGATIEILVTGYCTDVFTPPVTAGASTPSPEEYVVVGYSPTDGTVYIFPNPPVPPLTESDLPELTTSTGFTPGAPSTTEGLVPNWPLGGSQSVPMNGTIDPNKDPRTFAPVIVAIVREIERTTEEMQTEGSLSTPFSGDPQKEKKTVIQQITWLASSAATGEEYDKEDFAENVYEQFREQTGKTVSALPEEQKEQLDQGVEDFWSTFTAVGVEAKVFSYPEEVPISDPAPETVPEEEAGGCQGDLSQQLNPPFDYKMIIDEQWSDKKERQRIIQGIGESLSQEVDLTQEDVNLTYNISNNPTSSTSFWKSGHVGGFASAYAKTYFANQDGSSEWVWGTDRMETEANGTMERTMSYAHDEHCRAMVAGTAVVRVKATSSAFDAVAGNTERENDTGQLTFMSWTRFAGVQATKWLVARGRGKTDKSFQEHMTEQIQDQIQSDISDTLKEELLELAEQHLGGIMDELGLDDLTVEDLEMPDFELPTIADLVEELTGIEIPDPEAWLDEAIDDIWNLPLMANTYATANGTLSVTVGESRGRAHAYTSVYYQRESTEETAEAVRWSGDKCSEVIVSDCLPDALTIRTVGQANMVTEAMSKFGIGNGHADARLESMNLQVFAGLCICPAQRMTDTTSFELDVDANIGWYSGDENQQGPIRVAVDSLLANLNKDLQEDLGKLSPPELNSLDTETFERMLADKVRLWAEENPFSWGNCNQ